MADFTSRFEVPENRDIALCADELMDTFASVSDLKPGSRVVDFGSGTGLFLKRFSHAVGTSGLVLATEASDLFIDQLRSIVSNQQLDNVSIVKTSSKEVNLNAYYGTVDTVVICDVYHHLEFPKTLMRQIWRALKHDTGRLIVLDFIRDNSIHKSYAKDWIMQHVYVIIVCLNECTRMHLYCFFVSPHSNAIDLIVCYVIIQSSKSVHV